MSSNSGLSADFLCHLDDGRTLKAQVDMRDATAWERTFKKGWFENDRPSLAMMVWRCWHALQRQGEYPEGYPAFEKALVDMDAVRDDDGGEGSGDDVGPTPSSPGDES